MGSPGGDLLSPENLRKLHLETPSAFLAPSVRGQSLPEVDPDGLAGAGGAARQAPTSSSIRR